MYGNRQSLDSNSINVVQTSPDVVSFEFSSIGILEEYSLRPMTGIVVLTPGGKAREVTKEAKASAYAF